MDENIFEAASRQGKERKEKSSQGKAEGSAVKKNDGKAFDPEIGVMLNKMKMMTEDLESQLSTVYQKGKEAKVNVAVLIDSVNGLTPSQLEKLKEQEREMMEKFNVAVPAESCLKKPQKSKEKMTQERQGKMRGARNKWIPVR